MFELSIDFPILHDCFLELFYYKSCKTMTFTFRILLLALRISTLSLEERFWYLVVLNGDIMNC